MSALVLADTGPATEGEAIVAPVAQGRDRKVLHALEEEVEYVTSITCWHTNMHTYIRTYIHIKLHAFASMAS